MDTEEITASKAMNIKYISLNKAMKLMVTPERIRQIKDKAIEKLRTGGSLYLLQSYLAV